MTSCKLPRFDRIVLFTSMIGITQFARFAGCVRLPALPVRLEAVLSTLLPDDEGAQRFSGP